MDEYMTHELRLNINFCDAVYNGRKSYDIRRNDRGFQTWDHIKFIPFVPGQTDPEKMYPEHPIKTQEYIITHMMSGWGIENGYVVLGIKKI